MSTAVEPARVALAERLRGRFPGVPDGRLRRCVDDLWACCAHLGVRPEAAMVERLAEARLTAIVRGVPPSLSAAGGRR